MTRRILLLTILLSGCPARHAAPLPEQAERHRARTNDGWEISLVRYPPVGAPKGQPVLLCHGISANGRNMDLDEEHSLARWLAKQGRDAWTLSLRGTGDSDGADEAKGRLPGYTFDTFWQEDLAASIRYVRERTGAKAIDFVGHSMGGMLAYAYLARGGQGLQAVVTLGAPTRLDWGGMLEPLLDRVDTLALTDQMLLPVAFSSQLVLPLLGEVEGDPMQLLLYNPRNVKAETWKRLLAVGTGDLSGGVARQLIAMVRTGRFTSADGRHDFRANLAKVRTPVLVVAGKADRVAIVPAVRDGYRALGGPKEWLLLGEENGVEADYGHMDFVIGERAATEVWTKVLSFLDRHVCCRP